MKPVLLEPNNLANLPKLIDLRQMPPPTPTPHDAAVCFWAKPPPLLLDHGARVRREAGAVGRKRRMRRRRIGKLPAWAGEIRWE